MKVSGTNANRPATFTGSKTPQAAVFTQVINGIRAYAQPLRGLPDRQRPGVRLRLAAKYGCQGQKSSSMTVESLRLKSATKLKDLVLSHRWLLSETTICFRMSRSGPSLLEK